MCKVSTPIQCIIKEHKYDLILEAHPAENEDFKNQFLEIKTHQSLKDRLEAASKENFSSPGH